jgi:hypothetical protein
LSKICSYYNKFFPLSYPHLTFIYDEVKDKNRDGGRYEDEVKDKDKNGDGGRYTRVRLKIRMEMEKDIGQIWFIIFEFDGYKIGYQ